MDSLSSLYLRKSIIGATLLIPLLAILITLSVMILANSDKYSTVTVEFKTESPSDSSYPVYRVYTYSKAPDRISAFLTLESEGTSPYSANIKSLVLDMVYVDKDILWITIKDSAEKQWNTKDYNFTSKYSQNEYEISLTHYPFSFSVTRKADKRVIFDTTGMGFYFSERYIELETFANESRKGYGGGSLFRTKEQSYVIWPKSEHPGHHTFYLEINEGSAHGLFFHNFGAMEIVHNKSSIKYRAIGGIIDLFIMLGSSSENVVRNYHRVIGFPKLPHYSSLGYHFGRRSFGSTENMQQAIDYFENNKIPYDGMILGMNYLKNNESFTFNENFNDIMDFSQKLQEAGRFFSVEIPSGISPDSKYYTNNPDFFMPVTGNTNIGPSKFLDWENPSSESFWISILEEFSKKVKFNGVYLTGNEISTQDTFSEDSLSLPFYPGDLSLDNFTVPINTLHFNKYKEIDMHSLWGNNMIESTFKFLEQHNRTLIVSDNTRAGSKSFHSFPCACFDWRKFRDEILSLLSYSIYGVYSGIDLCGLSEKCKDDFCVRSHQVSVFYPFIRNFDMNENSEEGVFEFDQNDLKAVKDSILLRYSLSLYLYSLMFQASLHGGTVLRPMFFEFDDKALFDFPKQTMLGSALFGVFNLFSNQPETIVYLPESQWYNIKNGEREEGGGMKTYEIADPLILLRAGYIVPWQDSSEVMSLMDMRKKNIQIYIALDYDKKARGEFYFDDGISLNTIQNKKFTKVSCSAEFDEKLSIKIHSIVKGYTENYSTIESITIYGSAKPSYVKNRGIDLQFSYENQVLRISQEINTFSDTEIDIYY